MVCSKCGHECAEDMRFCTNCGAELEKDVAEVKEEAAEKDVVAEAVTEEETAAEAEKNVAAVEAAAEENEGENRATEEKATTEVSVVEEAEKVEDVTVEDAVDKKAKKAKKFKKERNLNAADLSEKKPMDNKKKMGLALVAIILLIFIPVALRSGDESYTELSKKAVLGLERIAEDGALYAQLRNGDSVALEDRSTKEVIYSMDRSTVCYINEEDELVIIKNGKVLKTAIEGAKNIVVSSEGDTLTYFSDCTDKPYKDSNFIFDDTIEVGTLHLYYIKKGKDVSVAEEVVVGSAVLSPNGETVAYITEYDAEDDFRGYYTVKGKKPVEVGKEMRVFAIADKAKYIYYTDADRIYALKKNKDAEKLASDIYNVVAMVNRDYTELLFLNDGKTYLSVKAGEKQKVSGQELNAVVLDSDAVQTSQNLETEHGYVKVQYTGVDTFQEKVFVCTGEDDVLYMLDGYETERLASNTEEFAVSDDGSELVYLSGEEIVKVTDFVKGGLKTDMTNEEEVTELYADGELKKVFFVNEDDELYYTKGKKAKKLADDVFSVAVTADGKSCYYLVEGEGLYFSKNAKKGKLIYNPEDVLFEEGGSHIMTLECSREGENVFFVVSDENKAEMKLTTEKYLLDGKELKLYSYSEASWSSILDPIRQYID